MKWKKAFAGGALLWVLMFVIISIFVGFGIYQYSLVVWLGAIIAGAISFIMAGWVEPDSYGQAFGYGLVWVIVALILDWIVTARFSPDIFSESALWLGYLLVLLAPQLRVNKAD